MDSSSDYQGRTMSTQGQQKQQWVRFYYNISFTPGGKNFACQGRAPNKARSKRQRNAENVLNNSEVHEAEEEEEGDDEEEAENFVSGDEEESEISGSFNVQHEEEQAEEEVFVSCSFRSTSRDVDDYREPHQILDGSDTDLVEATPVVMLDIEQQFGMIVMEAHPVDLEGAKERKDKRQKKFQRDCAKVFVLMTLLLLAVVLGVVFGMLSRRSTSTTKIIKTSTADDAPTNANASGMPSMLSRLFPNSSLATYTSTD
ncbi:expressed unknown protein [Seminavis robusta]|uniref:Transmembrane protein n=1 Tax=Seminavis robusta TaxID=568900 RepID=A0A9N8DJ72_9STRA|nr:expressed unknown protein [Seminavis robusta]|eukprot:Sro171_g075620.1 n/a (257) ;mRNA; f:5211-5981